MKTTQFSSLTEWLEKNREILTGEITVKTQETPYFKQFSSMGTFPQNIVTETFIQLLYLSLQSGDTSTLVHQYVWTAGMLESRGVDRKQFIDNFCDYMARAKRVLIEHSPDAVAGMLWEELFKGLEVEFRTSMA